ncbi:TonB-dependent receptor [Rhodovastum atsumiense]|uniref:TonB-dependent receptor n=2 Tax=Rhodovastum atsumiense TaxID=504468 RepID=A0A5M6ISX8_9PROT|nr:TonB-dependent receptor [Rhodovastum atsumiense]
MRSDTTTSPLALLAAPLLAAPLLAGPRPALAEEPSEVFRLGQINVTAQGVDPSPVGGSTLPQEEMWKFNRNTLTDAVNLIPGVVSSTTGGPRSEGLITVRGFDRNQVPLSIDGVRVYLPADARLDFNRFLTPDVSEIQVAKGYVSVIDGPGGMGGAINLVTRTPTKPFEAEFRSGLGFDNNASLTGYDGYGMVGSRQEKYYLQLSATGLTQSHFRLSDDFQPGRYENGGNRDHSGRGDWRVNAKVGVTPNATDEYSLNFTRQSGSKEAPLAPNATGSMLRYWDWPYWDVQSLYWLSKTQIGDATALKLKAYYNTFSNGLYSYDDASYTTQTTSKAFRSFYDDKAYGTSLEMDTDKLPMNTLKAAFFFRRDVHSEWQDLYTPRPYTEPRQTSIEDTWSVALENTFHATDTVDVVGGISYDWRDLDQARDWDTTTRSIVNYPLTGTDAVNWQGAVIWRYSETGKAHASVSSRTRFPTLFERFSSRFGGATSNPGLKPERAINSEIGITQQVAGTTRIDATVFYSHVKDVIETVPILYQGQSLTQSQNVGSGDFYGFELGAASRPVSWLEVGGNYTLIQRQLSNPVSPDFHLTDVPMHKVFGYVTWEPLPGLGLTPNLEATTARWAISNAGTTYFKTGAYVLANFQANWQVTRNVELGAGVRNIFDLNYSLTDSWLESGRTYYVKGRVTF